MFFKIYFYFYIESLYAYIYIFDQSFLCWNFVCSHHASQRSPFRLVATPFAGDPEFFKIFTEQINISYSKWYKYQTLTFPKCKRADQALKFYIPSTICKNASPEELLRKHFKTESASTIAIWYDTITFDPAESIDSFSNRLDNIVCKKFPQLPNLFIEQILIAKFTELISDQFTIYILAQQLDSYEKMVVAASSYQEILQSVQSFPNSTSIPPLCSSILSLNSPTLEQANNNHSVAFAESYTRSNSPAMPCDNCSHCKQTRTTNSKIRKNVQHFKASSKQLVCQWCSHLGHSANSYFKLGKLNASKKHGNITPPMSSHAWLHIAVSSPKTQLPIRSSSVVILKVYWISVHTEMDQPTLLIIQLSINKVQFLKILSLILVWVYPYCQIVFPTNQT